MAIPLTSESAPAPALSHGDQMLGVELREGHPGLVALAREAEDLALVREAEDSAVEGGVVVAGGGRKGKRAEYRCAACGYGIVAYGQAPRCPMCSEARWEHVEWRPFSQLLDDVAIAFGTRSQRRRLHAPSWPTSEQPIRSLRPDPAGASLEKCPSLALVDLGRSS